MRTRKFRLLNCTRKIMTNADTLMDRIYIKRVDGTEYTALRLLDEGVFDSDLLFTPDVRTLVTSVSTGAQYRFYCVSTEYSAVISELNRLDKESRDKTMDALRDVKSIMGYVTGDVVFVGKRCKRVAVVSTTDYKQRGTIYDQYIVIDQYGNKSVHEYSELFK